MAVSTNSRGTEPSKLFCSSWTKFTKTVTDAGESTEWGRHKGSERGHYGIKLSQLKQNKANG